MLTAGFGSEPAWIVDRRHGRIEVEQLARRLLAGDPPQILDVRSRAEWDEGHVEGSVLMTWHDIAAVPAGLDPGRPIAVVCASGQRASTAASLLLRHGAREVMHVVNGGVPRLGRLGVALTRP